MRKERIFGLDILRSIAILTVVFGHIFHVIPNYFDHQLVRLVFLDGVNIFFTLSGFLIGSILLKKFSREPSTLPTLVGFWRDRWWRTLPAYFTVLLLVVMAWIYHGNRNPGQFLSYPFFLQNMVSGRMDGFGESWSLAVEEWFYLSAPVLFLLAARKWSLRQSAPWIIGGLFVLGHLFRVLKVHYYQINTYEDYVFNILMTVPTRIDAVNFGLLGAYLSYYRFPIWTNYKKSFFWIGVIGFFANHVYSVYLDFNAYILYGQKQAELLLVLMTIPYLSSIKQGRGLLGRAITFVALTSYSIYLVHGGLFMFLVQPWLPPSFKLQLLAYGLWAFGAAYLLYLTAEKWGMRQREKRKARKLQPAMVPVEA